MTTKSGRDFREILPIEIDERPDDYQPSPGLPEAVEAALILGRPLLVTGDPGTGKTRLADWIAHKLGLKTSGPDTQVHRFETKSTSVAKDLFYTYDAIAAFHSKGEPKQGIEFVSYQAFGRAIVEAYSKEDVAHLLPQNERRFEYNGPRRAVVLIDEIDKAPRDFPNDLLNEIDRMYFRIPEFDNECTPGAFGQEVPRANRPIVVITSNSEKSLPEPFLRRCVFHHIPFPESVAALRRIVDARLGSANSAEPLVDDALAIFWHLRGNDQGPSFNQKPSTAELLDWVRLLGRHVQSDAQFDRRQLMLETLGTLVKDGGNLAVAKDYVARNFTFG